MFERPGGVELRKDVDDLNERIEELKKLVALKEKEVSEKLKKAEEYNQIGKDLKDWLEEKKNEADDVLPVDDLSSDELKKKADKAKDLKKELEERQKDKDRLNQLLNELTSSLPEDHPDIQEVAQPCNEVNKLWDDLSNRIDEDDPKLQDLSGVADNHESDYQTLSDWLGPTKDKVAAMATVPSDLSSVQDQLKAIEALEQELGEMQPRFESCCDSGGTLSDACQDPATAELMNKKVDALQEDWKDLLEGLNKAKEKLQRAAEGGEKLEGLVGDTLGWMDALNGRIDGLGPVGVKTPIIDEQTKEHESLMSEAQAGRGDVDRAQQVGEDMLKDLEGAEKAKLEEKLTGLAGRLSELEGKLDQHKEKLEDAGNKAQEFEDKQKSLDEWLSEKEAVLKDWEALPVDSAALEQHMDKIGEFDQEVANHYPTVVGLMEAEGNLLGAELEDIVPFETERPASSEDKPKVKFSAEKKKKKKKGSKGDLPVFMLRPGCQEVVDEAGELRSRYEQLKKDSAGKVDKVKDLLAKVQKYETDHEEFCNWLGDKKAEIENFDAVPVTPEEVEKEIKRVQDLRDEFEVKEPQLEDLNSEATELEESSGPTTSSEAVQAKVTDTNSTWDDLLNALDKREDSLKGGKEKATDYQDCLDGLSKWLKEVEEKLEEPEKTTGDPVEIANQAADTKNLFADMEDHRPSLEDLLAKAAELEQSKGLEPGHLGEKDLERRFEAADKKAKDRSDTLDDVLENVVKTDADLSDLLQALKDTNHPLSIHEPVHVATEDIQKQLDELKDLKAAHDELQPRVNAVVTAADVFAVPSLEGEAEGTSSGSSPLSDYLSPAHTDGKQPKDAEDVDYHSKKRKKGKKGDKEKGFKAKQPAKAKGRRPSGTGKDSPGDPEFTPVDVPSGSQFNSQLKKVKDLNGKNAALLDDWLDKTQKGLETAKSFEDDYDDLYRWIQDKKVALDDLGPVGSTQEKIQEQLKMVEDVQAALAEKKPVLEAVCALGGQLCREATPPDVENVQDELQKLNAAFRSLQDGLNNRKESLLKGGELSDEYQKARDDASASIGEKKTELMSLPEVGSDIETVQAQIEECKSLESEVVALKEKLSNAQDKGRKLMGICSDDEAQAISEELQDLAAQWSDLNAEVYARKHKLEEALLELGQFHDALAELLLWIGNKMADLSCQDPPGVEEDTVNKKIDDLKTLQEEIAARWPSVESVNEAAGKLVSSGSSADTFDVQNDIDDLNKKWKDLSTLCGDKDKELAEALEKAGCFHDNRNRELDWLDDMENKLGCEDQVHGLPEPCVADIEALDKFKEDIVSRTEPIKALVPEGEKLKPQGNPQEQQQVGGWVDVVQQRYDDLLGSVADRKHQLERALSQAKEFDAMYDAAMEWLDQQEARQAAQEPIHSDNESVQKQLEENKELQKDLDEHEGQIDEVVGCGNLLCRECVPEDAEVIQKKIEELQACWDVANTTASDRQSDLEKSLLALGRFEAAYEELLKWLEDSEHQLDNPESITGNPDAVGALLGKHKTFQKQLGGRNTSLNSVVKAGEMMLKDKEGEDAEVLKDKLEKLSKKWDDVCGKSVDRQQKLQDTYRKLGELLASLGPLRTWLGKMTPHLDQGEPLHGDSATVDALMADHEDVRAQLVSQADKFQAAKACGEDLMTHYLDDPLVTKEELDELIDKWNEVCQLADNKKARLDSAMEMGKCFDDQYDALCDWIGEKMDHLNNQSPPSEKSDKLDAEVKEQKDLVSEVNAKQAELDAALDLGREILGLALAKGIPPMESKLHDLDVKWSKLKAAAGDRSEELSSALLAMKGLQDMLDNLTEWVDAAEGWLAEKEQELVSDDVLEALEEQLAEHETFQEEMETRQPDMDALSKAEKSHNLVKGGKNSNDLDKKIRSLHKRWQKLGMKMHERHRLLKEAKDRCNDMEQMKAFDFETWRKRFNTWSDKNKLRPRDLLQRADGNRDGNLTKDELMKALKASGLPTNPVELNRVALVLDPDKTGVYNVDKVLNLLRPEKMKVAKEPKTDSEKIAVEIERQVCQCVCPKKFKVSRVSEGKYRFGESQQLRLVRILRSTVMVRVGGGWDPLDVFLRKHDPCKATGRTNAQMQQEFLRGQASAKPGLAMAGFKTSTPATPRVRQEAKATPRGIPIATATKGTPSGRASVTLSTPEPKTGLAKPRSTVPRQGTPERPGMTGLRTPTRATPTKHILPRKSPRHEGNDPTVTTDVKYTPAGSTPEGRPRSTDLLEPTARGGGQVKGQLRSPGVKAPEKKTTTTTFRGSKSPSPHTDREEVSPGPAASKEKQSRIPSPGGSKIPTPRRSGGK